MKNFKIVLKYTWISLVLFFAVYYCMNRSDQIAPIIHLIPKGYLLLSFTMIIVGKIFLSIIAFLSVKSAGGGISFLRVSYIYNVSQLSKYVPGSIWHFFNKAFLYRNNGMPIDSIKKSLIMETFWVLFSAGVIGFLFLMTVNPHVSEGLFATLGTYQSFYFIIVSILVAVGLIFICKYRFAIVSAFGNPRINIQMVICTFCTWLAIGVSYYMIVASFMNEFSLISLIFIVGLFALSYLCGFMLPFAPAGIGIRESLLIVGLGSILSTEIAIVSAIFHRVIYISAELLLALIFYYLYPLKKNVDEKTLPSQS